MAVSLVFSPAVRGREPHARGAGLRVLRGGAAEGDVPAPWPGPGRTGRRARERFTRRRGRIRSPRPLRWR